MIFTIPSGLSMAMQVCSSVDGLPPQWGVSIRQQHRGNSSARCVSVTLASAATPAQTHHIVSLHTKKVDCRRNKAYHEFSSTLLRSNPWLRCCDHLTWGVRATPPELSGRDSPKPALCIQHGCRLLLLVLFLSVIHCWQPSVLRPSEPLGESVFFHLLQVASSPHWLSAPLSDWKQVTFVLIKTGVFTVKPPLNSTIFQLFLHY